MRSTLWTCSALLLLLRATTALALDPAAEAPEPPFTELPPDMAFADPADPNPGSGRRKLIAGWIGLGVAAVNFAQLPFCTRNDDDGWWTEERCLRTEASVASVSLALGTTLLVLGYRQRAQQRAWLERHGLEHLLWNLRFAPAPGGAVLGYSRGF